jgi:hypothetical protein
MTAARALDGEFWPNLFGRRVRDLYFLLFETPRSRAKLRPGGKAVSAAAPPAPPPRPPSPE